MKKSPFIHLILALVLCAIALASYGAWYATVAAKSAAVTALQNQIDIKTETMSRLATTRAALAEIAGDEAVVQGYFVPETGVVAFINGLEDRGRAQEAAVSVLSVSTGVATARPTLVFALSISGTFDAVVRTVGAIEYAPYDITISALAISQDVEERWRADLKLLVGSGGTKSATTTKPKS